MPHVHVPYPSFDIECFTEIVRIVRERAISTERKWLAKHCWMIVSGSIKLSIGEPDNGPILVGQEPSELEAVSTEELTQCCEALEAAQGEAQSFGAGDAEAEAIDPALIAILIDLAFKIIKGWLDRRNPKPT